MNQQCWWCRRWRIETEFGSITFRSVIDDEPQTIHFCHGAWDDSPTCYEIAQSHITGSFTSQ